MTRFFPFKTHHFEEMKRLCHFIIVHYEAKMQLYRMYQMYQMGSSRIDQAKIRHSFALKMNVGAGTQFVHREWLSVLFT
jgi:hypothetical protein